jgi:hypothetical protein
LKRDLSHFLGLPVAKIQNTVFDKQSVSDLIWEFRGYEEEWKKLTKGKLLPQEGDKIVIQFPDGYAWWLLSRGHCTEEARAMGHCGNAGARGNDRILSLRHPVKAGDEEYWEPSLTFIIADGYLGEMKGRGNDKPARTIPPLHRGSTVTSRYCEEDSWWWLHAIAQLPLQRPHT